MNILLDTHILIWVISADPRLSNEALEILNDEENSFYYSVISLWEVAIKKKKNPSAIPITAEELKNFCEESGFMRLGLKDSHVFEFSALPPVHTDPFDNILISQAHCENMIFMTHDSKLDSYGAFVLHM